MRHFATSLASLRRNVGIKVLVIGERDLFA